MISQPYKTGMGDALKEGRQLASLTKYRLAELSGISHSNIFKVERGERFPTPAYLAAVLPHIARSDDERRAFITAAMHAAAESYERLLDETANP